ncbi:MAG: 2-oxoglutarate dehydrogenase, E2 component, dihydrolipoamide succinyltransferase, partial [Proteobacteria bacterium]|nr:2-oxoglutarate dehydrogenase, E2 component, dihydrolipoamide succinyltransferase [Pseudomonadota bacterium]
MKKTLALALASLMLVSFAGCNKKEAAPAPDAPAVVPAAPAANAAAAPAADANAAAAPAANAAAAPAADANAAAAPAVDPEIEKAANAIADAILPPDVPAPADVAAPPADA